MKHTKNRPSFGAGRHSTETTVSYRERLGPSFGTIGGTKRAARVAGFANESERKKSLRDRIGNSSPRLRDRRAQAIEKPSGFDSRSHIEQLCVKYPQISLRVSSKIVVSGFDEQIVPALLHM